MKILKTIAVVAFVLSITFWGLKRYLKRKHQAEQAQVFIQNIKSGKKNQVEGFTPFEGYNFEALATNNVIKVKDGSKVK